MKILQKIIQTSYFIAFILINNKLFLSYENRAIFTNKDHILYFIFMILCFAKLIYTEYQIYKNEN